MAEKSKGQNKNNGMDTKKVIAALNTILEFELAGVVRYTHYSLMVYGHNRIPIVSWLREQAAESLAHAAQAGENITTLNGHPSLKISNLLETHKHAIGDILKESLDHEQVQIGNYRALLNLVEGHSVFLEEYARQMIYDEELHVAEVQKMLRKPE